MSAARTAPLLATWIERVAFVAIIVSLAAVRPTRGQSIFLLWSGFAHTPQHDGISPVSSQPLNKIKWSAPVVKGVPVGFTHFSGLLVTHSNTVIFPMNLTNNGYDFKIEAVEGGTGKTNWERSTDYLGLAGAPVVGLALTPKNRLFFAGIGGTVIYCDSPDAQSYSPIPTHSSPMFQESSRAAKPAPIWFSASASVPLRRPAFTTA
jgi:hypothetical protein